eukprot:gene7679-10449_t
MTLFSFFVLCRVQEAADGSVYFNNCNGHGTCIDYSCHCFIGYHGDDCGTTYVEDENNIIPILGAGDFNLTRKNFTQTITKHKLIIVGFSSYNCHRCIQVEPAYFNLTNSLKALKIPFGRADADSVKSLAIEFGATDLPSLVLFNKNRPYVYKGVHTEEAIITYVNKQVDPPTKSLKTVDDVKSFIASRNNSNYAISTVMMVGFFSEHKDIEEDDYDDYVSMAKELQPNEDLFFGVVTNKTTSSWFKNNKTIDRTPSLLLVNTEDEIHTINLDELYGEKMGIKQWVAKKAIPLVGKMTPLNFGLYNKIGLPMLLFFLDLTDETMTNDQHMVGGRSGDIFNEVLLQEFRMAAREHVDRILFVYLDGTKHEDQMKSLGLYGGKERLPSLAFNTRDGAQIPFPEELPINKDTILQFCADFISGKLRSVADTQEMAKKALQASVPINQKNKVTRKEKKKPPEQVRGVSEQFGDGAAGDQSIVTVTLNNFEDIVMNEEKDVVLMLHGTSCESCSHFAVYFKRMALRFQQMDIPTLTIARMDVSIESPPAYLNLMVGALPILVMLPASQKYPPWNFYSGVGKVQPMMKWIQQQASIPFELPNLPHLTESDREAYKTQVREREESLDKKRTEDKRAMEAQDRARAEVLRKKRKAEKAASTKIKTENSKEIRSENEQQQSKIDIVSSDNFDGYEALEDHDEF